MAIDFAAVGAEMDRKARVREIPADPSFLPTPKGWEVLDAVRDEPWFRELADWLPRERAEKGDAVLPAPGLELEALRLCPLERVRVVLLAQDPYPHSAACGLAFSVAPGLPLPSSARAIREELDADGFASDAVGLDLRGWAEAGCLLLNATLTTVRGSPKAHAFKGWEEYTRAVLQAVLRRDDRRWTEHHAAVRRDFGVDGDAEEPPPPVPAVFVALGSWARGQLDGTSGLCIPSDRLVCAPHPAAREGQFRGSRPFSRCNARLRDFGGADFPWRLRTAREALYEALRAAWTLPPGEGKGVLGAALERAISAGFGLGPRAPDGTAPSALTAEERAAACDRADLHAVQSAYAKLSLAVAALKDAGRLLKPAGVSGGGR